MRLSQITSIIVENVDFSGIPDEYARRLQEFKPHYQEWGAKALREGKNIQSVIDCIKHYVKNIGDNRFQELLRTISPSPKNILTLTYDQLKKVQNDYDVKYHSLSKREAERLRKKQDLAGFKTDYTEILANEPGLEIVKFHEGNNVEEAAKIVTQMSKGTEWCTNGPDMAKEYLEQGPLYLIIIDGIKLLCHIETKQLMDVNDNEFEIDLDQYRKLVNYIPRIGMFLDKNVDKNDPAYKEIIVKIPSEAYCYARDIIKDRWPEAEPYIMKDPIHAYLYARDVIKGRWPEAEPYIMMKTMTIISQGLVKDLILSYATDVIGGRWPEAEPRIMENPKQACYYAQTVINGRWPEAEPYIMERPSLAYEYAMNVIKGRWPEAEPYIMKRPGIAYDYAMNVIKGRWPEAEPYIMRNAMFVYEYAKNVIKGRWPEAEPHIMKNPDSISARAYTRDIIGKTPRSLYLRTYRPYSYD